MALPMPRPRPGRRFAPKITTTIKRMTISSGNPRCPIVQLLPQIWNRRSAWIVPLFFGGLGGLVVVAQPPDVALRGQTGPVSTFSTGVNLVQVYATVTDRDGQPVTGLTAADFRV